MYIGFALVCTLLTVVTLVFCMCARCPHCVCARRCCCRGTCCGGRQPTQRPSTHASRCSRWCAAGTGVIPKGDGAAAYPSCGRWAARLYMLILVVVLAVFIGLGQGHGNAQLVPSLRTVRSCARVESVSVRLLPVCVSVRVRVRVRDCVC